MHGRMSFALRRLKQDLSPYLNDRDVSTLCQELEHRWRRDALLTPFRGRKGVRGQKRCQEPFLDNLPSEGRKGVRAEKVSGRKGVRQKRCQEPFLDNLPSDR